MRDGVEHLVAGRVWALQHDEGIFTAAPSRYLGHIATAGGDLAIAAEQFRVFWRFNLTSDHLLSRLLPDLMPLAIACGLPEQAAQLYGAGETVIRITHLAPAWPERGVHDQAIAQARAALGERAFEAATAAGRALTFDEALSLIETVLAAAESSRATDAAGGTDTGAQALTQREQEVLALLVDGKTNTEIGEKLFISHRTAQTHVTNILGKLGVTTRTEAAGKAVRDGLV
jgi:DNA-binding CsgD family transcriptional regulator